MRTTCVMPFFVAAVVGVLNDTGVADDHSGGLKLVEVRKIWDRPPHNAFTDLIRFQDTWFVAFREAATHGYTPPLGKIRVICSRDGKEPRGLLDPEAGTLTEQLALPSGGDSSYPGLVWHDNLRWVSYYSSHESKTSIYLAKVNVDSAKLRREGETGRARIETKTFFSDVLGVKKRFCVVLPEDYDPAKKEWPVLYLLHAGYCWKAATPSRWCGRRCPRWWNTLIKSLPATRRIKLRTY